MASRRARSSIGGTLIAAAAAAAYAGSFAGAFQFDDIPSILDNPTVRSLWPPGGPLSPPSGALTVSGRPVLNASFALNYAVSGYGVWSYHAVNLAIHLAVALVLFGLIRRTLARLDFPGSDGCALAAALIWVVHPLTTEAVTYVAQRAESLMGLFYLLTLYGFVRWTEGKAHLRSLAPSSPEATTRQAASCGGPILAPALCAAPKSGWAWLSVLCCLLGMATKEAMVSAPVAVLLYDRTFVAGSWAGAWRARKGYYALLGATWIPLAWLVAGTGWDRGGTAGFHVGISWMGYWVSQGEAVARYVGLSFWPHPLAFDYGPPSAPPWAAWMLFALLLLALAATVAGCLRGRRWAFLAGAGFLVLAPTSVMPGVLQFASEHRMYLPLAAVVTGAVVGVRMAASRGGPPGRERPVFAVSLVVLAVGVLGAATALRNRDYCSNLGLWTDTIAKRPRSAVAQANVGEALLERGRTAEALPYCLEAVRLDPAKPTAHYNLGVVLEEQSRWDDALREFIVAAEINPKLFYAQFRAGRLLDRLGRWREAEVLLRQALANAPDLAEAHGSLGVALAALGRRREAVEEFERALRLQPGQPEVEFDLGVALAGERGVGAAVPHYAAAARLRPDYGPAQLNLGVALAQLGRLAEARPALEAAVRLLPDAAAAHANLATVLDQLGLAEAAIAEYREALRLRPGYPEAHYNLGNALLRAHDLGRARAEFAEALRLRPDFDAAREMLARIAAFSVER